MAANQSAPGLNIVCHQIYNGWEVPCEIYRRMCDVYEEACYSQKMIPNQLNMGLSLKLSQIDDGVETH